MVRNSKKWAFKWRKKNEKKILFVSKKRIPRQMCATGSGKKHSERCTAAATPAREEKKKNRKINRPKNILSDIIFHVFAIRVKITIFPFHNQCSCYEYFMYVQRVCGFVLMRLASDGIFISPRCFHSFPRICFAGCKCTPTNQPIIHLKFKFASLFLLLFCSPRLLFCNGLFIFFSRFCCCRSVHFFYFHFHALHSLWNSEKNNRKPFPRLERKTFSSRIQNSYSVATTNYLYEQKYTTNIWSFFCYCSFKSAFIYSLSSCSDNIKVFAMESTFCCRTVVDPHRMLKWNEWAQFR